MPRGQYDISTDDERALYERGIVHFNAHEFFEAHEVWEDAWNGTSGRRRIFYQGLIQMAVSLVHYQRQNRLGLVKVYARACDKWAPLPDVYMGLDLRAFEQRMRPIVSVAETAWPGQPLVVDRSLFFPIRLEYDPFAEPRAELGD